jgi:glycosyltransferase involved in cell wall biosynthesis
MLVDPASSNEVRRAIERVLEDPALAARLASQARARAECFRWEISAGKSLEFFRDVAGF